MGSLVYPALNLRLPINDRLACGPLSNGSSIDQDAILEDSPVVPEDDELDYKVHPPDIGFNVEINDIDSEVPYYESPLKTKRVYCSFLSQNASNESDSDDYPFDAVTYGDCVGCFGLPYNDHNYASQDDGSLGEDRLTLLAKLALAKDDGSSNNHTTNLAVPNHTGSTKPCNGDGDGRLVSSSVPQLSPTRTAVPTSTEPCQPRGGAQSLITTASCISSTSNRALLLQSAHTSVSSPPLQVHRVSSSLTPHIVLRTGVPGLHISTVAPRPTLNSTTEPTKPVRCVCGLSHTDGSVMQCEKCKTWQHADCVSARTGGRPLMPHVCEQCLPRTHAESHALSAQRRPFSGLAPPANSGPCASWTANLNGRSTGGRLFVTNPVLTNPTSTPLQFCVTSVSNVAVAPTPMTGFTAVSIPDQDAGTNNIRCNLVSQPGFNAQGQPVRNSKRKQDLMTFAGSSPNAGLECVSRSSDTEGRVGHGSSLASPTRTNHNNSVIADYSETAKRSVLSTTVVNEQPASRTGSSLHNLLIHDKQPSDLIHLPESLEEDFKCPIALSPTISSDSPYSPQSESYEETSDLRLSERFSHKLESLFPSTVAEFPGHFSEDASAEFSRLKRCRVVSFDFNRKGVVASEDLSPNEPVVEYRGLCMLFSEYNETYDYRKHYNPFVLFYKHCPKLPLCVDARTCGNDARFIRRSCTPNCEVRHVLSTSHDPHSGSHVRLRLVISTTRPVPRSVELTLPFDFDYTACRYLVRCACARKVCPVARWFRQLNQFDAGENRNACALSSGSLLYSRKLPQTGRGTLLASGGRDTYADMLANKSDRRSPGDAEDDLDLHGLEFPGQLQSEAFRQSTGIPKATKRLRGHGGVRPTKTHGRSRDRSRLPSNKMKENRMEPSHLTAHRRRNTASRNRRKYANKTSLTAPTEPKTYQAKSASVVDTDAVSLSSDRTRHRRRSSGSERHNEQDDDTDSGVDETMVQNRGTSHRFSESRPVGSRVKDFDRHGSHKPVQRENSKPQMNGSQVARHRRSSDDSMQSDDKDKTREEIWMEEVLRRIERLEKKQQHSKQRNRSVSQTSVNSLVDQTSLDSTHLSAMEPSGEDAESKTCAPNSDMGCVGDVMEESVLCEKPIETDSALATDNGTLSVESVGVTPELDLAEQGTPSTSELLHTNDSMDGVTSAQSPTPASLVQQSLVEEKPSSNRRRRSQATTESSRSSTAKEVCETREERWLKSQLRRIAELETHSSTTSRPVSSRRDHSDSIRSNLLSSSSTPATPVNGDSITPMNGFSSAEHAEKNTGVETNTSQDPLATPDETVNHKCPVSARIPSTVAQGTNSRHSIRKRTNQSKAVKRTSNAAQLDTDCGFIVYRVQEQDPMAKFSRSRSLDIGSPPAASVASLQENVPPVFDAPSECTLPTGSSVSSSPAHTPLRPTKKRWLCQALMEEDNELMASGNAAASVAAERPVAVSSTSDDHAPLQPSNRPTAYLMTATAVNPKKRIISQLSEDQRADMVDHNAGRGQIVSVGDPSETPSSPGLVSQVHSLASSPVDGAAKSEQNGTADHTPLPPKKATVRRQCEEVRKVRVSLSEYRRRRGLSSTDSSNNAVKSVKEPNYPVPHGKPDLDSLPKLLSPNRLLDEIPKLYQQLRLPEKLYPAVNSNSDSNPSNGVNLEPVFDRFPERPGCPLTEDVGGPRTPSEPLDEDEFTNTVYAHRVSGLDVIEEECDVPMEKAPRALQSQSPHESATHLEKRTDLHLLPENRSPEFNCGDSRRSVTQPLNLTIPSTHPSPALAPLSTGLQAHYNEHSRRHSDSSSNPIDSSSSIEYYVKRDQKIRHWQETQSLSWEPRGGTAGSKRHHSHTLHSGFNRKNSSSYSRYPYKQSTVSAHDSSDRIGRLLDVEETLNRLHESLRTQLDRAKQAIQPHGPINDYDPLEAVDCGVFVERNGGRFGCVSPYGKKKFSRHFSYT